MSRSPVRPAVVSPAAPSHPMVSLSPSAQKVVDKKIVVKPQIERMREMHDAMARDRSKAKTNPAYRFKTQQGWADHFGLKSKKTIQRDCDYMRDRLRLPVYPIRERGGLGYTEDVGAFPLVATGREAWSLVPTRPFTPRWKTMGWSASASRGDDEAEAG